MYNKVLIKPNYFSNEWCDWAESVVANQEARVGGKPDVTKSLRRCLVKTISKNHSAYSKMFQSCMDAVIENKNYFNVDIEMRIEKDTFQHITYEKDHFLNSHFDTLTEADPTADPNFNRKLSGIIMLSNREDYTGGNFSFGYGASQRHDPNKDEIVGRGTLALFTSYTKHKVQPILSGRRAIILFWVLGPQWR